MITPDGGMLISTEVQQEAKMNIREKLMIHKQIEAENSIHLLEFTSVVGKTVREVAENMEQNVPVWYGTDMYGNCVQKFKNAKQLIGQLYYDGRYATVKRLKHNKDGSYTMYIDTKPSETEQLLRREHVNTWNWY